MQSVNDYVYIDAKGRAIHESQSFIRAWFDVHDNVQFSVHDEVQELVRRQVKEELHAIS